MSGFQTRLLPTVNPHTRPPLLLQLDIVSISIWSTRSTQPNQVVSVQHHLETTSEAIGVENEDDDTPSCTRQQFDQISSQTRPSVCLSGPALVIVLLFSWFLASCGTVSKQSQPLPPDFGLST